VNARSKCNLCVLDALQQAVRKSLDQDSRLVAKRITIRASFGDVTLDGSVYSHYEKGVAEQDAKSIPGVAWVTNNLFVRADQREDWQRHAPRSAGVPCFADRLISSHPGTVSQRSSIDIGDCTRR